MEVDNKQLMMQLISGATLVQAIRVAAELGVADALADGPQTAEALVDGTSASPERLFRVLRALASVGIFRQTGEAFELTPLAEHLRKDHPDTVWPAAVFATNELALGGHYAPEAVREGVNGFEKTYGCSLWDHLRANPDRGEIFDAMMVSIHGHETPAIVDAYDFSAWPVIVDVAGGDGHLLTNILRANPECRGVLFDLPEVAARTQSSLQDDPVSDRCDFEAGSFFEEISARGDLYMMRHIIHDWDDEASTQILENIRRVIPEHGRLLIHEGIIPPGNDPFSYKFLDLVMMVQLGGMERTLEQYDALLAGAGFSIERVVPTNSEISIIEAAPC